MNEHKNIAHNVEYKKWITVLRAKLKQAQLKAAVTVNQQLLMFYWDLGTDIIEKQKITAWGEGLLKQLSRDLMSEFPEMKGFSERNLRLIRQWVQFWIKSTANWQQAVAELTQIPWGHNQVIINICKSHDKLVVEYALSDVNKPIGVSEYQITQSLPEELKSSLPTVEEIEAEFGGES